MSTGNRTVSILTPKNPENFVRIAICACTWRLVPIIAQIRPKLLKFTHSGIAFPFPCHVRKSQGRGRMTRHPEFGVGNANAEFTKTRHFRRKKIFLEMGPNSLPTPLQRGPRSSPQPSLMQTPLCPPRIQVKFTPRIHATDRGEI